MSVPPIGACLNLSRVDRLADFRQDAETGEMWSKMIEDEQGARSML